MSGNKVYDVYDRVLDVLLEEAVELAVIELDAELEKEQAIADANPHEFSPAHERRMKRLFRQVGRRARLRQLGTYARRAAVVLLALVTALGVTTFSVEAWRMRFLNMLIVDTPASMRIDFVEGTAYHNERIALGFIPKGFTMESKDVKEQLVTVLFTSGDRYFTVARDGQSRPMSIDTRGAYVKEINLNGYDAVCCVREYTTIIIWCDDAYSYMIEGNLKEDVLVEIAGSVK